jgi:hypothetical protein
MASIRSARRVTQSTGFDAECPRHIIRQRHIIFGAD